MTSDRVIRGDNLSACWVKALIACRRGHASGMVVDVRSPGSPAVAENQAVRRALDRVLAAAKNPSVHETADTIFPEFLWRRRLAQSGLAATDQSVRDGFYEEYFTRFLPSYRARRRQANLKETYFQRMADFEGEAGRWSGNRLANQVERAICAIQRDLRRRKPHSTRVSALALAVFDPRKDYPQGTMNIRPLCGFPCLQQVSVEVVHNEDGGRTVRLHAMYPLEYIMERAYGNYLGLSQLGVFIAESCGLSFEGVCVYIAKAERGQMSAADADAVLRTADERADAHA